MAVSVVVLLVWPAAASAITRQQADQVALKALAPSRQPGYVAMFGLPAPLPAGARVFASDTKSGVVGSHPLARRAWLFWEDLQYQTEFDHPSRILLVDADSGRVIENELIASEPVVNGRLPAFLASDAAYHSMRYIVFRRMPTVPASALGASSKPSARAAGVPPAVAQGLLKNACLILLGDYGATNAVGDPLLQGSFKAMEGWASSVSLPWSHAATLDDASNEIKARPECQDVFLYIAGHGEPAPGVVPKEPGASAPTVHLGEKFVYSDQKHDFVAHADDLTQVDLLGLIGRYPDRNFKVKIDACFSGRFLDGSATFPQNLRVMEVASPANQTSLGHEQVIPVDNTGKRGKPVDPHDNPWGASEFTSGDVHGLAIWAQSSIDTLFYPSLEQAIAASSELGKEFNVTTQTGFSAVPDGKGGTFGSHAPPMPYTNLSQTTNTGTGTGGSGGSGGCTGSGTTASMMLVPPPQNTYYGYTVYSTSIPASCAGPPPYAAYLINDANGTVMACHQDSGAPVPSGMTACPEGNEEGIMPGANGSDDLNPPTLTLAHSGDTTWSLSVASYGPANSSPTTSGHVVYTWG